jgi:hypothetical protein
MGLDIVDGPGCKIDVTFIIPITGHRVSISLELQLAKFSGRVWNYIPGPGEDIGYGWFTGQRTHSHYFDLDFIIIFLNITNSMDI